MDATEKVMKERWRKYEGKWELMWVFVFVHPPVFGKGCVVSLAVHIRVGEHWLSSSIFSTEPFGGHRSVMVIALQFEVIQYNKDAGRRQSAHFLGKIFLWAVESICLFFPCFSTLVFGSSASHSSRRTVFWEGGNSHLVLCLWLMLAKVGDAYFKCLIYHLNKQCFAKFKCCS